MPGLLHRGGDLIRVSPELAAGQHDQGVVGQIDLDVAAEGEEVPFLANPDGFDQSPGGEFTTEPDDIAQAPGLEGERRTGPPVTGAEGGQHDGKSGDLRDEKAPATARTAPISSAATRRPETR